MYSSALTQHKLKYLFLFFLLLFITPQNVSAATITISNIPTEINHNQEVEINLDFVCSGCGDSYMRGVFYPSGTNYFGYTQNKSGSWVGTSADRSVYYLIAKDDLVEASWSGKLKVKPDSEDSAFTGTGEYLFKIGRYTSSNDSSADWSNELSLKVIGPTPSPTTTPTQTSEPTKTSTPVPTGTSTSKPLPTKTSTPRPSPTATSEPEVTNEPEVVGNNNEAVNSSSDDSQVSPQPTGQVAGATDTKKSPIIAIIFISLGICCLGYVGYMLYNVKHNNDQKKLQEID